MSLLMEALRMAEQAKQKAAAGAISPTRPDDNGDSPSGAISGASDTGLFSPESRLVLEGRDESALAPPVVELSPKPATNDDKMASGAGLHQGDSDVLTLVSSPAPDQGLTVELGTQDVMVVDSPASPELDKRLEPDAGLGREAKLSAPPLAARKVDTPVECPESVSTPSTDDVKPRAESEASREDADPEIKPPAIASVESSRQTARTVFAAKKEYQRQDRNRRLRVLGGVGGLAVVGLAVFFFYVYRSMALPVTSLPVVVVEKNTTPMDSGGAAVGPETTMVMATATVGAGIAGGGVNKEPVDSSPDSLAVPMPLGAPMNDLPSPVLSPVSSPSQEVSSLSGAAPLSSAGEAGAELASSGAFAPEALPEKIAPVPIVITRRTLRPQASLLLTSAYSAYQKGEFPLARNMYQQVLQADPRNRGALLGLAAIAIQGRETSLARDLYLRLLDQDPGDPLARAGMLAIAPAGDLAQQESELKLLLKQYPRSAPLLFSLGNIYAAGQRWSEAQQAYFEALLQAGNDAQNSGTVPPDYPFNMAVSLEHLGQMKPAVRYYQEALQLAAGQSAGFDSEALRVRLKTFAPGAAP